MCQCIDVDKVARITHDPKKPLKFPVNVVNSIEISVNESFKSVLNTKMTGPSGKTTQVSRTQVSSNVMKLSFQSEEIGM